MTETYKTYPRMRWQDKLKALTDDELLHEHQGTTRLKNLWDSLPIQKGPVNTHYEEKLKLIKAIMKDRGLTA